MYLVNEVFDKVYVINLNSRTDNLIEISQKLNRLGIVFERLEAVNGYSEENIKQYNDYCRWSFSDARTHKLEKLYKRKILGSPGAIGLLKSYKEVLLKAKKQGFKRILVFDDDAIFIKNFNENFNLFYKNITKIDWKTFALGATQHVWEFPCSLSYPSGKLEYSEEEKYYYPKFTDGTFAIGLDYRIFDLLLEEIEKMNAPVDSGSLRKVYSDYYKECIVAQPNLVVADVRSSDIRKPRSQATLGEKVKWKMENYDYPFTPDLVSVLMPTYNAEKTLKKSVESLINQTYSTIEIIIQDDASVDDTEKIGRRLAKKHNNVSYYRNQINVGCYRTRNMAIRNSKGRYLAVQDSDDVSLTHRIEKQVLSLIDSNTLISIGRIIRSKCEVDELDFKNEKRMMDIVNSRRIPDKKGRYAWSDRVILGLNTSMFCREVFINHGLFWEERFSGDAEILERVLAEKKGIYFPVDNKNIHTYLMELDFIEGVYKQINEVILISSQMGDNNITNKYKGSVKEKFEHKWRLKLKGSYHYEYPRFLLSQLINKGLSNNFSFSKVNELYQVTSYKENLEYLLNNLRNDYKILEQGNNELKEHKKTLEQQNRNLRRFKKTYSHLPKWYMKIGGFFWGSK